MFYYHASTYFDDCFVEMAEVSATEIGEAAVVREGAIHSVVVHFVVHNSQSESSGVAANGQTEENYLHHRQYENE